MARDEKTDESTAANPVLHGVHRRSFLKYLSAAFGTALMPEFISACAPASEVAASSAGGLTSAQLSAPVYVTRPTDLVSLTFQFGNLTVSNGTLVLSTPTTAYIVVGFPSQHIIEQPWLLPGTTSSATPFSDSYASGPSTLVFQLPANYGVSGGTAIAPYTLQGVLDLCALSTLAVAPNASSAFEPPIVAPVTLATRPSDLSAARTDRLVGARDPAAAKRATRRRAAVASARGVQHTLLPQVAPTPTPAQVPAVGQTSLEIPYRILLSPNEQAAWILAGAPVTSPVGQRTELWHARMAPRDPLTGLADPSLGGLTARALWNRDDNASQVAPPFYVSPTPAAPLANLVPLPSDRERIVQDTGNLASNASAPALQVDRLILSALGATLDVKGDFPTDPANVLGWKQQIALGRDVFVKVVHNGYLLPFGHSCVYTQICARNTDPTVGAVGTLYSWGVLTVKKPLVSYDQTNAQYLTFPFVGVELVDGSYRCAPLDPTNGGLVTGYISGSGPLLAGAIGIDNRGRSIKLTTQLVFVPEGASSTVVSNLKGTWNGSSGGGQSYALDGQRVAYAQPTNGKDDTSYETVAFSIELAPATVTSATGVNLVPVAHGFQLNVEAIRHLTGNQNAGAAFEYHPSFLSAKGFNAGNPNEALFQLATGATAPSMAFSKPQGAAGTIQPGGFGGFVAPDMNVTGLSRSHGPLAGATAGSATGGFNPAEFFGTTNTNLVLFGAIPLNSILQTITSAAGPYLPKVVTQELSNAEHFLQEAEELYSLIQNGASIASALLAQAQADLTRAQQLAGIIANPSPPPTAPSASDIATLNAKITSTLQPAVTALTGLVSGSAKGAINLNPALMSDATSLMGLAAAVSTDLQNLAGGEISALTSLLGPTGTTGDLGALLQGVTTLLSAAGLGAPGVVAYAGGLINDLGQALTTVRSFVTSTATVANAAETLLTDLQSLAQGLELAKDLNVQMTWRPKLQGIVDATHGIFQPSSNQALSLTVDVRGKATPTQPAGADMTIRMDQFAIAFGLPSSSPPPAGPSTASTLGWVTENAYVTLVFDHIQFEMLAGSKPDVDVVFKDVYFGGPLKFIETLKNLLPLDGFSDPPFLDITAQGIDAGFNLAVPSVAIGIFSIDNIAISADLSLAFVAQSPADALTFTFSFCSADQPFLVTVCMLGGGGYFSMSMNPNGLVSVSAAIEVCAQLAIDLGVASGSVSIEVGVYFSYQAQATATQPQGITLSGYLRLRGECDILGLITLSIELYMSLTYYSATGKVVGYASISVEIDIAFFSETVSVSYQRTFAGSNGDPTFADAMMLPEGYAAGSVLTADPFRDYCMAYAAA